MYIYIYIYEKRVYTWYTRRRQLPKSINSPRRNPRRRRHRYRLAVGVQLWTGLVELKTLRNTFLRTAFELIYSLFYIYICMRVSSGPCRPEKSRPTSNYGVQPTLRNSDFKTEEINFFTDETNVFWFNKLYGRSMEFWNKYYCIILHNIDVSEEKGLKRQLGSKRQYYIIS